MRGCAQRRFTPIKNKRSSFQKTLAPSELCETFNTTTNKEKPPCIEWRIRCFSVTATLTNHLINDCVRTFWKRNLNQPRGTSFKNGVEEHTSFDHLIIALTSICNTELTEGIVFLKEDSLWIQRQLNLNGNLAACLFSWPWEIHRVHFLHLFNDPWQVFIRINKVLIHSTWHIARNC